MNITIFLPLFIAFGAVAALVFFAKRKNKTDIPVAISEKGIGGWLLFFIIASALGRFNNIISEMKDLNDVIHSNPLITTALYIYAIYFLSYCIIGFYSLYMLLTINKNAVSFAKIIIIINPIFSISAPFVLILFIGAMNGVEYINVTMIKAMYQPEITLPAVATIIPSIIWFWYFSVSERVKNTWPEHFMKKSQNTT